MANGITPLTRCTPVAATSCTLLVTLPTNTFMVAIAYNGASVTAPTTPTGWTVIQSTTGNTNALKVAWKFSAGGETNCGTWTNATISDCEVYQDSSGHEAGWITASTLGGIISTATPSGSTGTTASTTLSYGTFTLQNPLSTSWVACAGAASGATAGADVAPTGMTLRSGTTLVNYAYSDTNGNVSTWSTQTVTYTTASHNATACWEMVGSPAISGLGSNLAHALNFSQANEPCTGSCIWTSSAFPAQGSGNFSTIEFSWGYTTTAPTVSSIACVSGSATFTLQKSVLDTVDTTDQFFYTMTAATSSCTQIKITASSVWTNFEADYQEWYNVTAVDVVAGQISSNAPYLSPGALTPTVTGDLIIEHCTSASMAGTTGGSSATNIFVSGGITPIDTYNFFSQFTAAFVETGSEALTLNNLFTSFSGNAICTAVALKTGSAGTAPSGVFIIGVWGAGEGFASPTTLIQANTLIAGDSFVLVSDALEGAGNVQWSGISDSAGNTFIQEKPTDGSGGYPNWAIICNLVSTGSNLITLTGTPTGVTAQYFWVELHGMKPSGCYDSTAGTPIGFNAAASTVTAMPSITPSTSSGIVFASSEMGTGAQPESVNAPSGAIFGVPTYSGQSDTSGQGLGNMFGYYLNTSTSTVSWGWTNGVSTTWNATAIALIAAPIGPQPSATIGGKAILGGKVVIN
jgi:hypothetical protein